MVPLALIRQSVLEKKNSKLKPELTLCHILLGVESWIGIFFCTENTIVEKYTQRLSVNIQPPQKNPQTLAKAKKKTKADFVPKSEKILTFFQCLHLCESSITPNVIFDFFY